MPYRHTQSARIPLVFGAAAVVAAIAFAVARPAGSGWDALLVLAFVFLAVVLLIASQLTVSVEAGTVVASFRWGWPRRRIPFDDIVGARRVRNSWWHGWGIRKVRHGWMYNVAGYDAVELALRSGKVFRIGTDQPDALMAALDATASHGSTPA